MDKKLDNFRADILVVDDEVHHAEAVAEGLARLKHNVQMVHSGADAISRLKKEHFDVIVTDLVMGDEKAGLDVLTAARKHSPGTEVILITGHSAVDTCRTALQEGACDYIEKPLNLDELRVVVQRAAERTARQRLIRELREHMDKHYGFDGIIGHSPGMVRILEAVRRIARSNLPVLVQGESGTGKELVAYAIHNNSRRKNGRFVALNCAGLSETLLEDELFGHVKGAYTGATADRKGRFEYADGGTIFLDEVGDMPAAMQAKLLRVLENGEVVRVGSNEPVHVDVRIISATNTNLEERVKEKRFREDLYFRLAGVTITIPPLRDRIEDIPQLIEHFIKLANDAHDTKVAGITPEAQRTLMGFDWSGNVRQLRNVVENMVVLAGDGKISVEDLPAELRGTDQAGQEQTTALVGVSISEAEKQLISNTLKMVVGNRSQAAKILGIGERTLYRKIKEYGLG